MPRIFSAKVIFYLILLLTLDICLAPLLISIKFQPILMYLMIIYGAFDWTPERTLRIACAIGILRDITISPVFGLETVILVSTACLLTLYVQKIQRSSLLMRLISTFLYVFLVGVLDILFTGYLTGSDLFSFHVFLNTLTIALSCTILMPFFFPVTAKWFGERSSLKQYELFR